MGYIRSFLEIGLNDVGLVGGKTASLGELYSVLSSRGIAVPNGFAITADAYRDALRQPGVGDELHRLLDGLDTSDIRLLAARAAKARNLIYKAMDTEPLRAQIVEAYRQFEGSQVLASLLPCGVLQRQKTCRPRALRVSMKAFSTYAVRKICSKHAGAALPPSSPTVQFPTASTTASITSKSRSPLP